MSRLRLSRPAALLAAFALFASALAPVAAPCAEEAVPLPCEGSSEPGTMGHAGPAPGGMDHGAPPSEHPAPAPPPATTVGMPCCALAATPAPRVVATAPPVALPVAALPDVLGGPQVSLPGPHAQGPPPGRPIPLHIAFGRFLT